MDSKTIIGVVLAVVVVGGLFMIAGGDDAKNEVKNVAENAQKIDENYAANIEKNEAENVSQNDTQNGDEIEQKNDQNNEQKISENMEQKTHAILVTNKGEIEIELFTADAPNTVANFVKLAGEKFYDGTKFHRIIDGFMIQGGDPLTKDDTKKDWWGTGGPNYKFADEIHLNNKNVSGSISMANSGPNTNGSQFFINVNDNNFLDTKHTVFGKVIRGMEVVNDIKDTQTDQKDRPLEPIIITNVLLK